MYFIISQYIENDEYTSTARSTAKTMETYLKSFFLKRIKIFKKTKKDDIQLDDFTKTSEPFIA